jgi:hypothetical protein
MTSAILATTAGCPISACCWQMWETTNPSLRFPHSPAQLAQPLLYQGTTSVVPKTPQKEVGFSPCVVNPEEVRP